MLCVCVSVKLFSSIIRVFVDKGETATASGNC